MALDKSKLKDNLLDWMNGKDSYDTIHKAMEALIDAYTDYAMDAEDVSGDPPDVVNDSDAVSILDTLQVGMTADQAADIWDQAIIAYWTSATFVINNPPPGTVNPEVSANVTTPPIPGTLKSELLTIFQDVSDENTEEQKAQELADAFDAVTKTVIVTCVGTNPSGGTLSVADVIS